MRSLSRYLLALLALIAVQAGPTAAQVADTIAPAAEAKASAVQPRTNGEIRQWYNDQVAVIPEKDAQWRAEGVGPEERARRAHKIRHDARIQARAMMPQQDEVRLLQARDREKYGNPDGPSFEQLVERNRSKGLTGEAVFTEIIGSSNRTDRATNERFGVTPAGNRGPP